MNAFFYEEILYPFIKLIVIIIILKAMNMLFSIVFVCVIGFQVWYFVNI